jgi:hypothetical protein
MPDLTPADFVACKHCRYLRNEHAPLRDLAFCPTATNLFIPEDEASVLIASSFPNEEYYYPLIGGVEAENTGLELVSDGVWRLPLSYIRFAAWKAKQ